MTWVKFNGTGFENVTPRGDIFYIPTTDIIPLLMLALFSTIFLVLFAWSMFEFRKLLDRYRLKYGFDRELEKKDMKEPTEDKLTKRENFFKKRVFKD